MVILFVIFCGVSIPFSVAAAPFCIPPTLQGFQSPDTLPTLTAFCFFDNSDLDRYEVTSHCGFGLYDSDDY